MYIYICIYIYCITYITNKYKNIKYNKIINLFKNNISIIID